MYEKFKILFYKGLVRCQISLLSTQQRFMDRPRTKATTWKGLWANQFYKRFASAFLRSRPLITQAQSAFTNRNKMKYKNTGCSKLTLTQFCPWCPARIQERRQNDLTEEEGKRRLPSPSPSLRVSLGGASRGDAHRHRAPAP